MKALHELDAMQIRDVLRPDLQMVHEDEPGTPALPPTLTPDTIVRCFFGGLIR